MRPHILAAVTAPPPPCADCDTPAKSRLFDALATATEVPHKGLHTYHKAAKSPKGFIQMVTLLARAKGKIIAWDEPLPRVVEPPVPQPLPAALHLVEPPKEP